MINSAEKNHQKITTNNPHSLKSAILNKIQFSHASKSQHSGSVLIDEEQNMEQKLKELKLLETVKDYESKNNKGYLTFEKWQEIHEYLWGKDILNSSLLMWKVLRLLNKGEVKIPTGLVYQVLQAITISKSEDKLKKVLDSFLMKNQIEGGLSGFRELKNFSSLNTIMNRYLTKSGYGQQQTKTSQKNTRQFPYRLAKENKKKENQIKQLKFQSLSEQMQQCSFAPSISKYNSKVSVSKTRQKLCQLNSVSFEEQFQTNFKASKIDEKIYQKAVTEIPGASKHIKKVQNCEHQKLRMKRYLDRPVGNFF